MTIEKKFMSSPPRPPPPPVDELFDGLCGKNFLGHLKKNIVQRNVAEKKILARNWGMKKNSCTENLPNPPLKNLMVRPLAIRILKLSWTYHFFIREALQVFWVQRYDLVSQINYHKYLQSMVNQCVNG